jgi:hypothetical protein
LDDDFGGRGEEAGKYSHDKQCADRGKRVTFLINMAKIIS